MLLFMANNIKSKDLEPHKEDIPFPEYWERVNVEKIKQMFNDWLDNNIEHEYMEDPEFYLKDDVLNERFSDVLPYLKELKSIGADVELTLAELSLLWLISLKEVSCIIIGVDNSKQLETHLQTMNKNIDSDIFEEALSIRYENENILNPSLWR